LPTPPIPIEITVKPVEPIALPLENPISPKATVPIKKVPSIKPEIITSDKEEINFVKNLINSSPADDVITITKIKNPQDYI
jgi:hypothetical protein